MDDIDWLPTESAPSDFPMRIVRGRFILLNGEELAIPALKLIHKGWGTMVSTHLIEDGPQPLPASLELQFFSYWENCFYEARINLPTDKLHTAIKQGYYSPKLSSHTTFDRIMVGVAPGGWVAIWLHGVDRCFEVCFSQAHLIDLPWQVFNKSMRADRNAEVLQTLGNALAPDVYQRIAAQALPLNQWETFHRLRYAWSLRLQLPQTPHLIHQATYINGEADTWLYGSICPPAQRALPKVIKYYWQLEAGRPLLHEILFDEKETLRVFQELPDQTMGVPVQVVVRVEAHPSPHFVVEVVQGERIVPLQLTVVKQFLAKESQYAWSLKH